MEKPLRIMYIISDLNVGGAEMMLYKLVAGTDHTRFEPVIVSMRDGNVLKERMQKLGVSIHCLGINRKLPTPLAAARLLRLTRRLRPSLIVGWMYHGCIAAQLANLWWPSSSVLWSIHYSTSSLAAEKWLTAAVIRACALLSRLPAKIIFVSQDGQLKHKLLGFETANSCVIPNGIDADSFVPSFEHRASVRKELHLHPHAVLIGTVGRYDPLKDHANFLRAAALLTREYPETHFLLAGRGIDDANQDLRGLIAQLGLSRNTHLLGERHDVPRLMAALDIFSLSSYCESFPTVIGEAMACAVPCVVTDVGDAALIVGATGHVVPPHDSARLAESWSRLIDLGSAGRSILGRAALNRVGELFALKSIGRSYEMVYDAAIRSGSARGRAIRKRITTAAQAQDY